MNDQKMSLYVVKDKVAEINSPIFEQVNDAAAVRIFRLKTLKEAGESAADFELYRIGEREGMLILSVNVELIDSGEKYAASEN